MVESPLKNYLEGRKGDFYRFICSWGLSQVLLEIHSEELLLDLYLVLDNVVACETLLALWHSCGW